MTSEAIDLTPDECPGCNDAILCVQRTRAAAVCDRCGETYLPAYASAAPAPVHDGDARLDMECVPGDLYAAVGYVLNHLAKNGFTTLVIQAEPAPDDSGGA